MVIELLLTQTIGGYRSCWMKGRRYTKSSYVEKDLLLGWNFIILGTVTQDISVNL